MAGKGPAHYELLYEATNGNMHYTHVECLLIRLKL